MNITLNNENPKFICKAIPSLLSSGESLSNLWVSNLWAAIDLLTSCFELHPGTR